MGRVSKADRAAIAAATALVGPPSSGAARSGETWASFGPAATDTREPIVKEVLANVAARTPQQNAPDNDVGGIAADRLRSIVERIERLEEEKKALSEDINDIYAEGKSAGFDVKVLRQLIRVRKMEPAVVEEQETLLDLYRRALGM